MEGMCAIPKSCPRSHACPPLSLEVDVVLRDSFHQQMKTTAYGNMETVS